MRRADKEITDRALMETIIIEAQVCRLAMAEDNVPYVVPMNFGYSEGFLYFHCAGEGRKLDIIARNPSVCFELESRVEISPDEESACGWGTRYYSIIGYGEAVIIEDYDEKRQALDTIMRKYSEKDGWEYNQESVNKIKVIRVAIHQMSAKKSGWQVDS